MKKQVIGTYVTLSALLVLASPCSAVPHQARGSLLALPALVTGAELEVPLGATPLRLGGQGAYVTGGSHAQGTIWMRLGHAQSADLMVGGLVGLNQTWDRRATPAIDGAVADPNLYPGPLGYVIGVSVRKDWGPIWAQANPNYVLIPGFMNSLSSREALISGIPWLEVGYRVTPTFELSLRAAMTPLTASILF